MALYVSVATRRRRTVVIAVVTGVLALALGWVVGRQQVPSVDERVSQVQADAGDVATGLERLDIEYEQVLAGAGDTVEAGVIDPLQGLREELIGDLDDAPWITQPTRTDLLDRLAEIESSATRSVPLDELRQLLDDTGAAIRAAFGVSA